MEYCRIAFLGGMDRLIYILLIAVAFMSVQSTPNDSKLAFLFLTKKTLPLAPVWANFFGNISKTEYSIYVHTSPAHFMNCTKLGRAIYSTDAASETLFHNATISDLRHVHWGGISVVDAELALFRAAYKDKRNKWFILLSESCIPIRTFSFVKRHLLQSNLSFLDNRKGTKRYVDEFQTWKKYWAKGSQWAQLKRADIAYLLNNETQKLLNTIQTLYNSLKPSELSSKNVFCMDEHYKQVIFNTFNLKSHQTLTYMKWSPLGGKHPLAYDLDANNTAVLIVNLNKFTNKFLFARKFYRKEIVKSDAKC